MGSVSEDVSDQPKIENETISDVHERIEETVLNNLTTSISGNAPLRRRWDEAFATESSSSPEPDVMDGGVAPESADTTTNLDAHKTPQGAGKGATKIICEANGKCGKTFANVKEYEQHYNLRHRHSCSICKRSLPSGHILEMHVLEAHDTLFSLMAERKPMLQCFLETCTMLFSKPEERQLHCLSEHAFPKSFKLWDLVTPTKSPKDSKGGKSSKGHNKQKQPGKSVPKNLSKGEAINGAEIDSSEKMQLESDTVPDSTKEDINAQTANCKPQKSKATIASANGNQRKPKPVHISFGKTAARAFKPKYSFGISKPEQEPGKSSEPEMELDLSDMKAVLPSANVDSEPETM